MLISKICAIVTVALLMAGCVLQSEKPIFSEADGSALPKTLGQRFEAESFVDNVWKKDEGIISFVASGKHYLASNSTGQSTVDVLFVKLEKAAWVMQASEKDKPSAYVLAEANGNMLMLQPLLCDDLKKQEALAKTLRFEGSDCFLKGKGNIEQFRSFKAKLAPARMRLVPVP